MYQQHVAQAITNKHIFQNGISIKAQQAQQLAQYAQDQITTPTLSYLNETLTQRLQGLQPDISQVLLLQFSSPVNYTIPLCCCSASTCQWATPPPDILCCMAYALYPAAL